MSKYTSPFYNAYHWVTQQLPKVYWRNQHVLTDEEKDVLAKQLASGYYIILTGNKYHLGSIIVSLLSWLKTGKWSRYTHALMNCDNITDPSGREAFKFIEADVNGVVYTTFDKVFKCSAVCLLSPNHITNEDWTKIIDSLLTELGRPYDDLFDLADSSRLSCVEVVLNALKAADYADEFKNLDAMIKSVGNLVPQMYRECPDFVVVLEK